MKKRTAACIALAALMICLFWATASAEQTERNLMLGSEGLKEYDAVYIGDHKVPGCHRNEPDGAAMKWHVVPNNEVINAPADDTKLAIFSNCVFGYDFPSNSPAALAADAFAKSFAEKIFDFAERAAVSSVQSPKRLLYSDLPHGILGIGMSYWTNDFYLHNSYYVSADGEDAAYDENDKYSDNEYADGVRPCGLLNKESVLFISKAPGGKSIGNAQTGFVSNAAQEIDTWRFTLKDQTRSGFAVTSAELNENGTTATVHYTGAKTGANEYISAIITDGGSDILYYGRFRQLGGAGDAEGTVTITCPENVALGADRRLYVFNEQYNGGENDTQTVSDYASGLCLVNLVVRFDTQGNGSAPDEQIVGCGLYAEEPAKPQAAGMVFGGWFRDAACTQAWDFASDAVTEDITLYAKWSRAETQMVVKPDYTDADIQATDLGKIPELDTVAEIDAQLRADLAQKGAASDTAVLYDVILQYLDADGEWKNADREHFPEEGIEVVLPAVEGTTPATHVYKVAHMFTMDLRGKKAGDVEYPVPTAYQDENGAWMLKFTVTGLSPIMVAAVPIPAQPQTGDTADIGFYAMLLAVSVMGMAAAKRRRSE